MQEQEEGPREFAPVYERTAGAKVSTVVCNHTGFEEIYNMLLSPLTPGFCAKAEMGKTVMGPLIESTQGLYINRGGTEEERDKIVETIMARQI